ncbi:MAG: biotin synthase [Planctomycetes bacterium ADurb.Bin126]|nr:MAG: biotin synthase [Planctomycetes bacterium ADurb.Bin126]HOD80658.1 cobalamin-dependent protein [Phycisphaerae bacterium]HQL73896.1 cobalamin-dependent protein [Phycisphaerae bacterium]
MTVVDAPLCLDDGSIIPRTHCPPPRHPLGSQAKVLLCSVFGPYAQDDEFGSRRINPMELWHNQVTRLQGPFSLRMFHRSWGLMLIQANISARCALLDYPTLERFIQELEENRYDVIGISGILPNLTKVRTMCKLIRKHQPQAVIVVGGHISGLADLDDRIDADHIVRGEGVRWFREFLGEDGDQPIRHPQLWSGFDRRTMGIDLPFTGETASAVLIPSVGCPLGCNFCSTSAMFGGKGRFVSFYQSADELFAVMCQLADALQTRSFFVMDENFLLQKTRSLELLELMRKHDKSWALYVFSSANALRMYTMEELVGLGISWVWMGLEGKNSQYGKLRQTDTHALIRELQAHGIRVLGSSIVGLEEHTPENIDQAIAHAVSHDTDFHQFMLYTPVPGTPLHAAHQADGSLLDESEIAFEDTHGQYRFNFRHPGIPAGMEEEMLLRAFAEDFRVNGPSVLRVVHTTLQGWRRHKNHADPRVRRRFVMEADGMRSYYAGAVWAARRFLKHNPVAVKRLTELLHELYREYGLVARLSAQVIGRIVLHKLRREDKRLRNGWTCEPPTFYERNYEDPAAPRQADLIQSVPGLANKPIVVGG